jgi:sulfofructosephosphate aldolase
MTPTLDAIARPTGVLAMVAMDQRDSLRTMFDAAGRGRPADDVLIDFKVAVADALGPLASGFLIDRHFGYREVAAVLPETAGLILAADALTQADGEPVEETALDDVVLAPDFDLAGAVALKLLIIWRRDEKREQRIQLARDFIDAAAQRGLLSVLEPVVRATPRELADGTWQPDASIREAAAELSPLRPSLYKVQVPLAGAGTAEEQLRASEELAKSITGPWVVLSQGVAQDRFLPAVEAACRSGASGFLAGRALWSDVVGSDDVPGTLRERSVPRLEKLVDVVDRYAQPWSSK